MYKYIHIALVLLIGITSQPAIFAQNNDTSLSEEEKLNIQFAKNYIKFYNEGLPNWVDRIHSRNTEWVEMPLLDSPGRSGGFDVIKAAATETINRFPDRKIRLIKVSANDDIVSVEYEWFISVQDKMNIGDKEYEKGDRFIIKFLSIFRVKNQKAVMQIDYPLSTG